MARPRKSKATLELHGSWRAKQRVGEPEPAPEDRRRPNRPEYVGRHPGAGRIWDYLAPVLERMGTLSKAERETLAHYCVACAVVEYASDFIAKRGGNIVVEKVTPTADGFTTEYKDHPVMARMFKAMAECRKIEKVLGISAGARAELAKIVPVKEQKRMHEQDTESKFFGA